MLPYFNHRPLNDGCVFHHPFNSFGLICCLLLNRFRQFPPVGTFFIQHYLPSRKITPGRQFFFLLILHLNVEIIDSAVQFQ